MHDERGSPLLGHRPGLMVSLTALSPRSKFLIPLVATISVMSFFTQLDHLTGIADTASPGLNLTTGEKDLSVKVYSSTNSSANVALCLIVKDETPYIDELEPAHYKMLDATVSIGINFRDTKHEFDDLARMLTAALACHKAGGGRPGSGAGGRRGLFVT